MKKITFVIPTRNNLEFLKLAYKSIKRLGIEYSDGHVGLYSKDNHDILVLDDVSVDGTYEWLISLNDPNVIIYRNMGPEREGVVGMFDKGIAMAKTDIIFAFHADMVAAANLDINILRYLRPGKVVCATRVEPPLHPPGSEKITHNFGIEPEEFNFDYWDNESPKLFQTRKITEGIFAPWCMYKEDYLTVGGHDPLFAPQSKEDSDLFNRFVLNGYEVIQSWDALVYHFTSRGSRFNKHSGGSAGVDSPEWQYTTNKNARNFIRKWGHFVKHDALMKPIIPHKYNVSAIIHNCNSQLLELLEPWFTNVYVRNTYGFNWAEYCDMEQRNTIYDLRKRVHDIQDYIDADITLEFDAKRLTQQSFNIIQNLSDIITDSGEPGEFELDIFKIKITNLQTYEKELIICHK